MIDEYKWVMVFGCGMLVLIYMVITTISQRLIIKKKLLGDYTEKEEKIRDKVLSQLSGYFRKLGKRFLKATPLNMRKNLAEIIKISGITVSIEMVLALKFLLMICFAVVGVLLATRLDNFMFKGLILLLFTVGGFKGPNIYLMRKGKMRQMQISKTLPAFIEYLTISVEAGLSLDMAIYRIVNIIKGPLAEEIKNTFTEIQYGKSKKEAFKSLEDRVRVAELSSFLNSLISGEQLGIGLSNILRVQGEQIREKRKQKMREKAYQTPVKLVFPLVLFILPTLFIVLLGPAAVQLFNTFMK